MLQSLLSGALDGKMCMCCVYVCVQKPLMRIQGGRGKWSTSTQPSCLCVRGSTEVFQVLKLVPQVLLATLIPSVFPINVTIRGQLMEVEGQQFVLLGKVECCWTRGWYSCGFSGIYFYVATPRDLPGVAALT